jgi:peptide/nickel transport system permease protein
MMRFLVRRVFTALLTLLLTSAASFYAIHLAPGDFLSEARLNPTVSPSATQTLEIQYQLSAPVSLRYWAWLSSTIAGDWGRSYNTGLPIAKLIFEAAGETFVLVVGALCLAWTLSLALSWRTCTHPGSWLSRGASQVSVLSLSIPDILLVLGVAWGFSSAGLDLSSPWAAWLALFLGLSPALFLQVQAALLEADGLPFVQAARDRRLPDRQVIARYLFPAAAPRLAALFGLSLGSALSSSLLVECTLARPGLGTVLLEAILARDVSVVMAGVTLSTSIWIAGNLTSELLQLAADPRLRAAT